MPPLRNVTLTEPWMHNGANASLEEAIRHHLNATDSLASYSGDQLRAITSVTLRLDDATVTELMRALDPLLASRPVLSGEVLELLLAFLQAQNSPSAANLSHLVPEPVPSGLPIQD